MKGNLVKEYKEIAASGAKNIYSFSFKELSSCDVDSYCGGCPFAKWFDMHKLFLDNGVDSETAYQLSRHRDLLRDITPDGFCTNPKFKGDLYDNKAAIDYLDGMPKK